MFLLSKSTNKLKKIFKALTKIFGTKEARRSQKNDTVNEVLVVFVLFFLQAKYYFHLLFQNFFYITYDYWILEVVHYSNY